MRRTLRIVLASVLAAVLVAAVPILTATAGDGAAAAPEWRHVSTVHHFDAIARPAEDPSGTAAPGSAPARIAVAGELSAVEDGRAPVCPSMIDGSTASVPAVSAADGAITGTADEDLAAFAQRFNEIRVENCLDPVPFSNFRHDQCLQDRLIWIAEDPSSDPASAWGHDGTVRSDGVPSVGCDGNLAGGSGNTGATVAEKWWDSLSHRAVLYRPDVATGVEDVCVAFAMTHGGIPNEPLTFTRAAARWTSC